MGHGVCDILIRSTNLSVATSDHLVIGNTLKAIWQAMKIAPSEVRGMGVVVTKLGGENVQKTSRVVPVGKQSVYKSSLCEASSSSSSSLSSCPPSTAEVSGTFFNSPHKKARTTFQIREFISDLASCMRLVEDSLLNLLSEEPHDHTCLVRAAFEQTRELVKDAISNTNKGSEDRLSVEKHMGHVGDRWALLAPVHGEAKTPHALHQPIALPLMMHEEWKNIVREMGCWK